MASFSEDRVKQIIVTSSVSAPEQVTPEGVVHRRLGR